jgi:hypothetical protein
VTRPIEPVGLQVEAEEPRSLKPRAQPQLTARTIGGLIELPRQPIRHYE